MDRGGEGVHRDEADVGGERRPVAIHGVLYGVGGKRAVGSGAEYHHVWRESGRTTCSCRSRFRRILDYFDSHVGDVGDVDHGFARIRLSFRI